MINVDEFKTLLERMMSPQQVASLMGTVITRTPDGTYQLFGDYEIDQDTEGYLVSKKGVHFSHKFGVLRSGVAWCIMDRRNKIKEAREIIDLDAKISSHTVEIIQQSKLKAGAKELGSFLIHETKLDDALVKRAHAMDCMDNLIEQTRIWQEKKFREYDKPATSKSTKTFK